MANERRAGSYDNVSYDETELIIEYSDGAPPAASVEIRVTQAIGYAEYRPQPATLKVTQVVGYLEYRELSAGLKITQAQAYAEYREIEDEIRVTQATAYAEYREETIPSPVTPAVTYNDAFAISTSGPPSLYAVPEPVSGYALDSPGSFWHVVVPEETVNLVKNPSFGFGNLRYTFTGTRGVPHIDMGDFHSGDRCMRVPLSTNSSVSSYLLDSMPTGKYTWSLYIKGFAGQKFSMHVNKLGDLGSPGLYLSRNTLILRDSRWTRVHLIFSLKEVDQYEVSLVSEASNYISGSYYKTDSWQVEAKDYPTTFASGDMGDGYEWMGPKNNSFSRRDAHAWNGGRMVSLRDSGFMTTSITGLDMPSVEYVERDTEGPVTLEKSKVQARNFTITGRVFGDNDVQLNRNKSSVIRLFNPRSGNDGRKMLIFQPVDRLGYPVGDSVRIPCVYVSGMEGTYDNFNQAQYAIQLRTYDGLISSQRNAEFVTWNLIQESRSLFLFQAPDGSWSPSDPSNAAASSVSGIATSWAEVDGKLYVGGNFDMISQGTQLTNLFRFSPDGRDSNPYLPTYEAMEGLRPNATIHDMIPGEGNSAGGIIVCGDMTTPHSGIYAVTKTFSSFAIASGLSGGSVKKAIVRGEYIYAFGSMTQSLVGGINISNGVARTSVRHTSVWQNFTSGSTWSIEGTINSADIAQDGTIYVGGQISLVRPLAGPTPGQQIRVNTNCAQINPDTGEIGFIGIMRGDPILSGTGTSGGYTVPETPVSLPLQYVNRVRVGRDGAVYFGGFIPVSSTTDPSSEWPMGALVRWTGSRLESFGGGIGPGVQDFDWDSDGRMWIVGIIQNGKWGVPKYVDGNVVLWTGSEWRISPAGIKQRPMRSIHIGERTVAIGTEYNVGYGFYSASTEDVQEILCESGDHTSPQITVSGTGAVHYVKNITTGQEILFKGLSLESDVLTIEGRDGVAIARTDNKGDVERYMSGSSQQIVMVPGHNKIVVKTDEMMAVRLIWENLYAGIPEAY